MARGRKALDGTYEARLKIDLICQAISGCELSEDACNRVIKAVKFGLGIKEEEKTIEKINKVLSNVMQEEIDDNPNHHPENCKCEYCQDGKEIVAPIKEKKASKTSFDSKDGDEYFAPEDCYEAN